MAGPYIMYCSALSTVKLTSSTAAPRHSAPPPGSCHSQYPSNNHVVVGVKDCMRTINNHCLADEEQAT